MHSRIVELSNEPILVDERLSEDSIPEWFYHTVADYTNADTDRGQDIKWFLEHVGGIVDVAENGLSFSFKPNAKQMCFYIYYQDELKTLDDWIRKTNLSGSFYFGGTLDYHY